MGLLWLLSGATCNRSCFITQRILNVAQLRTLRTTAKNHLKQQERPKWMCNSSIYIPQTLPPCQPYPRCLMGRWITLRSVCQLNIRQLCTWSRKGHGRWIDTVSNDLRKGLSTFSTNTAVAKDVVLFEHDRTRFFRFLALFCGGQLLFWTYLAHFAFTGLRDTRGGGSEARKVRTELGGWFSFDMNLGSNAWRFGFTVGCITIGEWYFLYCFGTCKLVMLNGKTLLANATIFSVANRCWNSWTGPSVLPSLRQPRDSAPRWRDGDSVHAVTPGA